MLVSPPSSGHHGGMLDTGVTGHDVLLAETTNQAGDAIIAIDRQGIIRVWNQKCVEIFGWPPESARGSRST